MTQYVLCYAVPDTIDWDDVLLIEKLKPEWQRGKLNLPGGKIEENESIHEAASRELREETGIYCGLNDITLLGRIYGEWGDCYVCHCVYRDNQHWEQKEAEKLVNLNYSDAIRDERLIDNLRLIIPWCLCELNGWSLYQGPMHYPNQWEIKHDAETEVS